MAVASDYKPQLMAHQLALAPCLREQAPAPCAPEQRGPATFVGDVLSPAECAAVVEACEAHGFRDVGYRAEGGVNATRRVHCTDAKFAAALYERVARFVPATVRDDDGSEWKLCGVNARCRVSRYEKGQSNALHVDGAVEVDERTKSFVTLLLYLNGNVSGGATEFIGRRPVTCERFLAAAVQPTRGAAVLFLHDTEHAGAEVIDSRKYIFHSELLYQRV